MIMPLESDLRPVIFGEHFDRLKTDVEWQGAELLKCEREPWYFLVNYCWTERKDEKGTYIERFPAKEYLRLALNDLYERPKYAVSKTRQMILTWLCSEWALHTGMFRQNESIFCQSKKQEDANEEMVKRAHKTHCWLPGWFQTACPVKYKENWLRFPKTQSYMHAIPEGGDQIRSHNPNILISDEIAFQPEAEKSYTAALACCKRIVLVTSANPGWARDFYKDELAA